MENLEKIAEKLENTGVRYLVIDAGWYKTPDCDNWFDAAGDWNEQLSSLLNDVICLRFPSNMRSCHEQILSSLLAR